MLFGKRNRLAAFSALALIQLFSSCASAPPPRKPTVNERIEFDRAIGTELAQQMAPQLTYKKDAQVQAYLNKIAQRITDKNPELHLPEVKVFLLKDTDRRYRSYGLPGGRVYLSSSRLKTLEFESEVAAMISIELGHVLNEHVQNYLRKNPAGLQIRDAAALPNVLPLKTLEAPEDIDFFSKDGVFAFSAKDNDEAIASAVNLLYDAGYDPRGLVTFLQRLNDNPAHSPWDEAELFRILEQARKSVALLTPLRNPIVQTDDFDLIRGKIQKL
jgi:predicted Zn-dependent protease